MIYISIFWFLIKGKSCLPRANEHVCAAKGSSQVLTFIFGKSIQCCTDETKTWGSTHRTLSNFPIQIDLKIHNITPEDEGYYHCYMIDWIKLHVASK